MLLKMALLHFFLWLSNIPLWVFVYTYISHPFWKALTSALLSLKPRVSRRVSEITWTPYSLIY